eukprot:g35191.t1
MVTVLGLVWLSLCGVLGSGQVLAGSPEESVTYPVRLDQEGRELELGAGASQELEPGQRIFYRLHAFGQQFVLELEPDHSFLAPVVTLQRLGDPEPGKAQVDEKEEAEPDLRRCFYGGTVNSLPGSLAAVSLCHGIQGAFVVEGAQYHIQPVNRTHLGGMQPHFIRRTSLGSSHRSDGTKCG